LRRYSEGSRPTPGRHQRRRASQEPDYDNALANGPRRRMAPREKRTLITRAAYTHLHAQVQTRPGGTCHCLRQLPLPSGGDGGSHRARGHRLDGGNGGFSASSLVERACRCGRNSCPAASRLIHHERSKNAETVQPESLRPGSPASHNSYRNYASAPDQGAGGSVSPAPNSAARAANRSTSPA
jgi:hypothetical protein